MMLPNSGLLFWATLYAQHFNVMHVDVCRLYYGQLNRKQLATPFTRKIVATLTALGHCVRLL